jgi:FAD/FMN-containing dehydrogenase
LPGVEVLSYGHVGDGNVHVNALRPVGMEESTFRPALATLTEVINELVDSYGGSISAEHGIGLSKRAALETRLSSVERVLMERIKHAIDPASVMSPGRIFRDATLSDGIATARGAATPSIQE